MFDSPIFETVLSLTLLMLFFSILVSCVQEGYVSFRKSRGKMLEQAIQEVLDDKFNKNFAHLLYQHPQIDLLKKKQGDLPSYIDGEIFAKALIDLVAQESTETVFIEQAATFDQPDLREGKASPKVMYASEQLKPTVLPYLPGIAQKHQYAFLEKTSGSGSSVHDIPLEVRFSLGLETLRYSDLKNLLLSFNANTPFAVQQNTPYLPRLQKEIQQWYDGYMNRVTGWYKRQVRTNIMFASFLVVVALNLNFITVSKTIYADSNLRGSLTNLAVEVGSYDKAIDSIKTIFIESNAAVEDINFNAILGVELPIGWNKTPAPDSGKSQSGLWKNIERIAGEVWKNLLGWLLFTLGLSLGAPFWFDILKKFVNVRNAGTKPSNT